MDARETALRRLEGAGVDYYITGSEALALHGVGYRQTNDMDVVLGVEPGAYDQVVRGALEPEFLVSDLVHTIGRSQGSAIHVAEIVKVDFFIRDRDRWGDEAFARREAIEDPVLGRVWVSTLEDLVVAKLEWATIDPSELQLRDVARILRVTPSLDRNYLERQIVALGLSAAYADAVRRAT